MTAGKGRHRRLLFASWHCVADPASGAASATMDLLQLIRACDWETRAFCGPLVDSGDRVSLRDSLRHQGYEIVERHGRSANAEFDLFHFRHMAVPITAFAPRSPGPATRDLGETFVRLLDALLDREPPDVVLTYGGDWISSEVIACVQRRGISVVFALHNFAYHDRRFFRSLNHILVPSTFSRDYYWSRLGIESTVIPSPLLWSRIVCTGERDARYVTFVERQTVYGQRRQRDADQTGGRRSTDSDVWTEDGRQTETGGRRSTDSDVWTRARQDSGRQTTAGGRRSTDSDVTGAKT